MNNFQQRHIKWSQEVISLYGNHETDKLSYKNKEYSLFEIVDDGQKMFIVMKNFDSSVVLYKIRGEISPEQRKFLVKNYGL